MDVNVGEVQIVNTVANIITEAPKALNITIKKSKPISKEALMLQLSKEK